MPSVHAFLAPSASKRWMTCPPSAKAESMYPAQDTVYTKEGTFAHSLAELMLRALLEIKADALPEFDQLGTVLPQSFWADAEMLSGSLTLNGFEEGTFQDMLETVFTYYVTPVYEDYLVAKTDDPDTKLLVEAELSLSLFIPEGFGSSDAVIISGNNLRVYDLKYGRGVKVEAENNPQMMCYALGALYGPAQLYDITVVSMTILQPRLRHTSTYAIAESDLVRWGYEVLKPAAEKAFKGEGAYTPGDHCKFCKAAPRCRALMLTATVTADAYGQPDQLTVQEFSEVLTKLSTIKDWVAHVEEFALKSISEGVRIPGWKMVEGRSVSKISNQDEAIRILSDSGLDSSAYMKAPELKTITELKKTLRPKAFEQLLGHLVEKPTGKPTLAPADDPRPEFSSATNDFKNL